MNKYFIEFLGTYFLVLVIALTGNPLAIGFTLTALVYMGGYISGANYNPAVTLALLVSGKMKSDVAIRYILVQLFAGLMSAVTYNMIYSKYFTPSPAINFPLFPVLLVEFLFTFLLTTVVLHVAATAKTKGNDYYGLAIGLTLAAIAFAGGPVSGGVFNPAIAVGPILYNFNSLQANFPDLITYIVGPLTGGIFAGLIYKGRG